MAKYVGGIEQLAGSTIVGGAPLPPLPGLPQTGQATSYPSGDSTDRDDGYYERGYSPPSGRFHDNGDGTVTDNATGLMWVNSPVLIIPGSNGQHGISSNQIQTASGNYANTNDYVAGELVYNTVVGEEAFGVFIQDLAAVSNSFTFVELVTADYIVETTWTASAANLTTPAPMAWSDSISICEGLDYAGYTDWRLPNANEVVSIVNFSDGEIHSALGTGPTGYLWSSTTRNGTTTSAYQLYVGGSNAILTSVAKTSANDDFPHPVRGGRS